jgi:hypothetical protein
MHLIRFRRMMRDAAVAHAIHSVLLKYGLSVDDTTKLLRKCGVPRAANVAEIAVDDSLASLGLPFRKSSAHQSRCSNMPQQKRKPTAGVSRLVPKRDTTLPNSASAKERKQLAHSAPVRRAASKFRE